MHTPGTLGVTFIKITLSIVFKIKNNKILGKWNYGESKSSNLLFELNKSINK